jgi:hypothetical protein
MHSKQQNIEGDREIRLTSEMMNKKASENEIKKAEN